MEETNKISIFEDLVVWQLAIALAAKVYESFRSSRDVSLKDQIQRAATSISSNIAEGFERGSNKEFIQFLFYAKGSCGEVRSQAQLARRIKLLSEGEADALVAEAKVLSAKLGAFINVRINKFN